MGDKDCAAPWAVVWSAVLDEITEAEAGWCKMERAGVPSGRLTGSHRTAPS